MSEAKYKNFESLEKFCELKENETEKFQFYKSNGLLYYQDENFESHQILLEAALKIIKNNAFCILPSCESIVGCIVEIFPFKGIAIERKVQEFDSFVNDAIEIMNGVLEITKSPIERINEVDKLKIPTSKEELECLLDSGFYYYYA